MQKLIIILLCVVFFQCDKNPVIDESLDCSGVLGGDALVDNCGTCDSDLSNDCLADCSGVLDGDAWVSDCGCVAADNSGDDCDDCSGVPNGVDTVGNCGLCGFSENPQSTSNEEECVPDDFVFSVTTQQAGYVFESVTIGSELIQSLNCNEVDDCDWVGAFNGDVCIGAIQWNSDSCLNGICSINVMGNDYGDFTPNGYINNGEIPNFKIYDVSENIYYDAIPSEDVPWFSGQVFYVDSLLGQP